jgi:hypothetical protein
MPTVAISVFLEDTLPDLPGCPVELAIQQIRHAAIEWCAETRCWPYEVPAINAVTGTHTYTLTTPTDARVSEILWVWYGGPAGQNVRILYPKATDALASQYQDWRNLANGYPQWITTLGVDVDQVRLVPPPRVMASETLRPLVTLKPTLDATTIDDKIHQEYVEWIAMGAKARLMLKPGKPYTSVELGTALMQQFKDKLNETYNDYQRSLVRDHGIVFRMR